MFRSSMRAANLKPAFSSRLIPRSRFSERVYKTLPTGDLINSYVILRMCKSRFLMNNMDKLVRLGKWVFGENTFYGLLKATMGRHFTAGETLHEAQAVIHKYDRQGFKSALNYMAEFLEDQPDERPYDECLKRNIDTLHLNNKKQDPLFFFAIKFSGLTRLSLLKKMNENQLKIERLFLQSFPLSEVVQQKFLPLTVLQQRLKAALPKAADAEISNFLYSIPRLSQNSRPDELNLFEWKLGVACYNLVNPSMNSDPIWRQLTNYTDDEIVQMEHLTARLKLVLEEMEKTKSYLLIDAEQSFIQIMINNFTEQLSYLENYKRGNPCIFNTIQNYLVTARNTVADELAKKQFFGPQYPVLLKMVRGAYHKEEQGVETATGRTIVFKKRQETNDTYNNNCLHILENLCPRSRLFVASHNEETVDIVGGKIDASPKRAQLQKQVFFATLLGLNDKLAYKCINDGRTTIKYMPFGERNLTLPYMLRRTVEAKELIRKNANEVKMYSDELWNRILWR